jgi:hypothetical protein
LCGESFAAPFSWRSTCTIAVVVAFVVFRGAATIAIAPPAPVAATAEVQLFHLVIELLRREAV